MPLEKAMMPDTSTRYDTPETVAQDWIMMAPDAKKRNAAGRLIISIWAQGTFVIHVRDWNMKPIHRVLSNKSAYFPHTDGVKVKFVSHLLSSTPVAPVGGLNYHYSHITHYNIHCILVVTTTTTISFQIITLIFVVITIYYRHLAQML